MEEMAALNDFEISDIHHILGQIQTFHPPGIAAFSIQHSLLVQLDFLGKRKTLAYKIIEKYFDHLIHNHIPLIKKGLKCTTEQITEAIKKDIAHLDLHPGTQFLHTAVQTLVPDLSIVEEEGKLLVVINDDTIPSLRLNRRYLKMLEDKTLPEEAREFIHTKVMSAKWLLRNIHQRNETLEKIALILAKRQIEFFKEPNGQLTPLTMREVAEEIEMHESTVARAVSNKCLNSPRGIFPLRYFFTHAYETEQGTEISSKTVKDVLQEVIDGENKLKPLTDDLLSQLLKNKGIPCARRTVAKYRGELNIGSVNQRRKFE
jgi:RNA polymerase sigma-54 factor